MERTFADKLKIAFKYPAFTRVQRDKYDISSNNLGIDAQDLKNTEKIWFGISAIVIVIAIVSFILIKKRKK